MAIHMRCEFVGLACHQGAQDREKPGRLLASPWLFPCLRNGFVKVREVLPLSTPQAKPLVRFRQPPPEHGRAQALGIRDICGSFNHPCGHEQGLTLIMACIDWMMHGQPNRCQLIIMGKGEPTLAAGVGDAEARFKGRICGYVGFDPCVERRTMWGACIHMLMDTHLCMCT